MSFIRQYRLYFVLFLLLASGFGVMAFLVHQDAGTSILLFSGAFFSALLFLLNGYVFYAYQKKVRVETDFLASMSHKIRTPLAAISGIAEIFSCDQDNLDERQKKLVLALSSSTASLKGLADDMLAFLKAGDDSASL